MSFIVIDYIFVAVIILFAIIGVVKGFVDNIFGKLSWILGILGAFFFYERVATGFFSGIGNKIVAYILAFLILFVVIFLIVKMLQIVMGKIFSGAILGSLDKALGFFFGIVEGIAVVALVIFILGNQPFFSVDNLFNGSFFYGLFEKYMPNINIQSLEGIVNNV